MKRVHVVIGILEFDHDIGFGFESKVIFVQIDIRTWCSSSWKL